GVFAILEEARALMLADELDKCRGVRLPILRKALQILENGAETGCRKNCDRILRVFVEVGVEDAHVLEVSIPLDLEEIPSEVMQLEHGEDVRLTGHRLLDVLGVFVEDRLPSGDDLRDDGEAVARRSPWKDRAVPALLHLVLDKSPFGDRHGGGLRPILSLRCNRHNSVLSVLSFERRLRLWTAFCDRS